MGKFLTSILFICPYVLCYAQASISAYDLEYSFDFSKGKLYGKANITFTTTDTVDLLLYRLLTVRSVKNIKGIDIPFTQNVLSFSDWEEMQANSIKIHGNNINQVSIEFAGYLAGYLETGMLYTKDRVDPVFTILRPDCFAYPVPGVNSWELNYTQPAGNFDYKISITVPDSLVAVNGGKLVDLKKANGESTYVYTNLKPAWRIDIAIAKYQAFDTKEFTIQFFPEDSAYIKTTAGFVAKAFDQYAQWFGSRPSRRYTIIEIPDHWGSQTDVTSILQEASAFRDKKQLYQLYHEISHVWNLTPIEVNPSRFESEGLAMFLQYLMMEKLHYERGALDAGAERSFQRLKKQFEKDPASANIPISEYGKHQLTDLSYTKGMLFFYVLYKKTGEEKFMKSIAGYLAKHKTTSSLQDFVDGLGAGKELAEDWIWTSRSSKKIRACETVSCLILNAAN